MTDSNVGASSPFTANLRTEVAAFATRIPAETAARAADIYVRTVRASADLLEAAVDRAKLAVEIEERYVADAPADIAGGDWVVAIEDHIGLSAALWVMLEAASGVETACCCTGGCSSKEDMDWPETAWPLGFPGPGLEN